MVDITPAVAEQRQLIQSYGDGGFRIAGIDYNGSVLIEPEQTHPWPIVDPAAVTLESLGPITRSGRTQPIGGMVMLATQKTLSQCWPMPGENSSVETPCAHCPPRKSQACSPSLPLWSGFGVGYSDKASVPECFLLSIDLNLVSSGMD